MLNAMMAPAFPNIEWTDYVTVDVLARVLRRITHTRLRSKMHHSLELFRVRIIQRSAPDPLGPHAQF
jgi:hypothetical protein